VHQQRIQIGTGNASHAHRIACTPCAELFWLETDLDALLRALKRGAWVRLACADVGDPQHRLILDDAMVAAFALNGAHRISLCTLGGLRTRSLN